MGAKQAKEEAPVGREKDKTKVVLVHRALRQLPVYDAGEPDKVETLDVSHNKLPNMFLSGDSLGRYQKLTTLIADDNRLSDFMNMPQLDSLRFLSINSNQVKDVDLLCAILSSKCPALHTLSLVNNPCYPSYEVQHKSANAITLYRSAALRHLPKLKMLDCVPVTQRDREAASQLEDDIAEGKVNLDVALKFDAPSAAHQQMAASMASMKQSRAALRESKRQVKKAKKEKEKGRQKGSRKRSKDRAGADGGEALQPPQPPPPEAVGHAPADWSTDEEEGGEGGSDAELDAVLQRSQVAVPGSAAGVPPPPPPPDASLVSLAASQNVPVPPLPPSHPAAVAAEDDWSSSSDSD